MNKNDQDERQGVQMKKYKISTIMPTYNVQGYIDEAINSVAAQENPLYDLELIVIDDGSTDGTVNVVEQLKEEFPGDILVIQQDNEGPGAARNKGINLSTGDFIAFLDGDDILYDDAYFKLLQSAMSNNADIVVGNVDRFNSSSNHFVSGLHRKIFDNELSNTHIINNHSLLYDTTSWNKLFRADFLKKYQILFPENILYEDIPFNMEAHLRSTCTNIITDKVYRWRLRDGNDKSITQSRFEFKNLEDRITAIKLFSEIVTKLNINDTDFIASKEFKELTLDFPLYMDHLKDAPEGYSEFFQKEFLEYKAQLKSNAMEEKLTSRDRIKYFLLEKGDFSLLKKFVEYQGSYLRLPTKKVQNQQVFDTTNFEVDLSQLPLSLVDVKNDHQPITKIQRVFFEENKIFVEGYAFHKYIDLKKKNAIRLNAFLFDPDAKETDLPLKVTIQKNKQATHMHGGGNQEYLFKRYHNYDWSGFVIEINLADKQLLQSTIEKLGIKIVLSTNGIESELPLANPIKGGRPRPKPKKVDDHLFTICYNAKWQLQLDKKVVYGYISELDEKNQSIQLAFSSIVYSSFKSGIDESEN
jgi:CDP-glycerol glycerophosphotransferase